MEAAVKNNATSIPVEIEKSFSTGNSIPLEFKNLAVERATDNNYLRLVSDKLVSCLDRFSSNTKKKICITCRMIDMHIRGVRCLKTETVAILLSGFLYVLCPLDLIPDVLPVIGHVDDAAVMTFVIDSIKKEMTDFTEWESENKKHGVVVQLKQPNINYLNVCCGV